jgi:hypothetical protein
VNSCLVRFAADLQAWNSTAFVGPSIVTVSFAGVPLRFVRPPCGPQNTGTDETGKTHPGMKSRSTASSRPPKLCGTDAGRTANITSASPAIRDEGFRKNCLFDLCYRIQSPERQCRQSSAPGLPAVSSMARGGVADFLLSPLVRVGRQGPARRFFTLQTLMPERDQSCLHLAVSLVDRRPKSYMADLFMDYSRRIFTRYLRQ